MVQALARVVGWVGRCPPADGEVQVQGGLARGGGEQVRRRAGDRRGPPALASAQPATSPPQNPLGLGALPAAQSTRSQPRLRTPLEAAAAGGPAHSKDACC